jgi:hypothetical protein
LHRDLLAELPLRRGHPWRPCLHPYGRTPSPATLPSHTNQIRLWWCRPCLGSCNAHRWRVFLVKPRQNTNGSHLLVDLRQHQPVIPMCQNQRSAQIRDRKPDPMAHFRTCCNLLLALMQQIEVQHKVLEYRSNPRTVYHQGTNPEVQKCQPRLIGKDGVLNRGFPSVIILIRTRSREALQRKEE